MTNSDEPIVVVSADCHAGNSIKGYKQYLEKKYWDDFDAWAEGFVNPFSDLDEVYADRNWDSAKRLHDLEVDVSLEQSEPDLPQRGFDRVRRQA